MASNCSDTILGALHAASEKLTQSARREAEHFVVGCLQPAGGFTGRDDQADPYYSHFGYTLALTLGIDLPIDAQYSFLENCRNAANIDFVHAVSIVRCYMALEAMKALRPGGTDAIGSASSGGFFAGLMKRKLSKRVFRRVDDMLELILSHRSTDGGFNHERPGAPMGSVYATFIAQSLFDDLGAALDKPQGLVSSVEAMICEDGSFANEPHRQTGVATATAAAVIVLAGAGRSCEAPISWLADRFDSCGGCAAAKGTPIADMLSTSTALLALKMSGQDMAGYTTMVENFVDLHWDESGGFFGSAADLQPDCEYTYYALLALGLV